ncbi:MAG: hypothetical protein KDD56_03980, partial [Bdellovibrionales bacterium]|nr:hypothetical protein [Bdellovibrionales bacterium]
MKKLIPIVLIIAIAAYFFISNNKSEEGAQQTASVNNTDTTDADHSQADHGTKETDTIQLGEDQEEDEDYEEVDIRPATEVYSSSEEAFEAVKKGAQDYDDIVLEQFVEIKDCQWCPEFYKSVKDAMLSTTASEDEQSYYSEILAISGSPEQIETLVNSIKNAKSEEQADLFAESLELALGDDSVVNYLKDELSNTSDALLKESLVAAITNQGSRLAAETLYEQTVASGDPDGYYSVGIGLGEMVPEEEALPYLQELVHKRDEYSHLAFKALLNEGINGLQMAMDELTNSKNPEFDKKMIQDAVDHVAYEEDIEEYLNKLAKDTNDENVRAFAKEILDELAVEEEELASEEDQED